MMRKEWIVFLSFLVAALSVPAVGAGLFPTEVRRQAFLKALSECDSRYDAREQMLQSLYPPADYFGGGRTIFIGGDMPCREVPHATHSEQGT